MSALLSRVGLRASATAKRSASLLRLSAGAGRCSPSSATANTFRLTRRTLMSSAVARPASSLSAAPRATSGSGSSGSGGGRSRWWSAAAGATALCSAAALGLTTQQESSSLATAAAPTASNTTAVSSVDKQLQSNPKFAWYMHAAQTRNEAMAGGGTGGGDRGFLTIMSEQTRAMVKRYGVATSTITAVNVGVFGAWKIAQAMRSPVAHTFMERHFTASVVGLLHHKRYHTLLTAVFSHMGLFHLGFNTMALTSMAPPVEQVLGTSSFTAFYLGAGVFSSITGKLVLANATSRVTRQLAVATQSLGASGAVCAVFAFSVFMFPDSRYQLIFAPGFHFSGKTMLAALVAFDIGGTLYGWRRQSPLGHGAHLGGVLFGLLYYQYCSHFNTRVQHYQKRLAEIRRQRQAQQAHR